MECEILTADSEDDAALIKLGVCRVVLPLSSAEDDDVLTVTAAVRVL
jgi:hypothetical protein